MTYLPTPPSEPNSDRGTKTKTETEIEIKSKSNISSKEATIYLHTPFHPKAEEYAKSKFGKIIRPEDENFNEIFPQTDGILLRVGNLTRDMILKANKLQIISRNGVGIDNIHIETAKERGITITNCPGGNAQAVAELALTLTLTLLRRVVEIDNRIRLGEKVTSIKALSPGLFGKTIGLIGMGDISYEFSKLLLSFNCKILIYSPTSNLKKWTLEDDPNSKYSSFIIPHKRILNLNELLKNSDVISIHCPLNEKTKGLIGKEEFKKMKKNSIIINTARGGIINERELENALENNLISGAGIDVWEIEPAFGDTMGKLGKLKNTVVLPHLGGSTDSVTLEGCMTAIDIMADYFDGKPIKNRVI
ncbi:uncharacterized protein I206_106955 [Kwoniella pini CBS 10737]|uniref:Phosphoglycerate dehydrogenase n=1 Tax=Kwoniella pini CBS 10737 TaxID=1296096 RepID=A0A1B9HZM6_9TREE|nr:uncharacterized protein I206_05503 [Kwoniella pini CBS 10737]OCF48722.1 hypothetical protein I206_05503 [Kwoniella pini CBS 10737]